MKLSRKRCICDIVYGNTKWQGWSQWTTTLFTCGKLTKQDVPIIIIIPAEGRPLLDIGIPKLRNSDRFRTSSIQWVPATFIRSSVHSRNCQAYRSYVMRAVRPAHCHLSLAILQAMSVTLVLLWISLFLIRSRRGTPSIALYIWYSSFHFCRHSRSATRCFFFTTNQLHSITWLAWQWIMNDEEDLTSFWINNHLNENNIVVTSRLFIIS